MGYDSVHMKDTADIAIICDAVILNIETFVVEAKSIAGMSLSD